MKKTCDLGHQQSKNTQENLVASTWGGVKKCRLSNHFTQACLAGQTHHHSYWVAVAKTAVNMRFPAKTAVVPVAANALKL
jgi:hypothetical protein